MEKQRDNLNTFWSNLIIEELTRNGINYFCISPGARSTSLISAAALNTRARTIMIYDERSSAYHALGYGKFNKIPAVVITTSGTAVSNLYPAIIEAYYSAIPIIILTADRPPELQGVSANQTIDQDKIFGSYVKTFINLPCPDINIMPEFILDTIGYAASQCIKGPQGPIHINCQFRKPLEPNGSVTAKNYISNIKKWQVSDKPYSRYISNPEKTPEIKGGQYISEIIEIINSSSKGLISIGTLSPTIETGEIMDLVAKLDWPVYADVTSGLRLTECGSNIIKHFDQEVLSSKFNRMASPEVVLHLGGRITSKRFGHFLDQNRPEKFIVINDDGSRNDPSQGSNIFIETDINSFLKAALKKIIKNKDSRFKDFYNSMINEAQDIIESNSRASEKINEVFIARHISEKIPDGNCLFLSSSMPIRDMDLYGIQGRKNIPTGSNRGTSGIDGVISTAAGFAQGNNKPCTLIIGDHAFIHDLNALSMIRALNVPMVIILVNNQGGGIFHFLPISKNKEIFEEYFVLPHNFTFKGACSSFGIGHFLIQDKKSFISKYETVISSGKSAVLEVKTEREYNLQLRRKIKAEILQLLEE